MLPALGNNEGRTNYDFPFELNSEYLKSLYTNGLYDKLIGNESFAESGFYSKQIADGLRAVIFNSVVHTKACYKKHHKDETINPDPLDQFKKLKQELTDARQRGE